MPSPNTMARRPTERRWNCLGASARLERDDFPSNRYPTLSFCLSMIFFGKPVSTFPDHALAVVFQEVVHLVRTEEAEVAKLQCSTERPDEQPQECASDAQRSRGHGTQCGGRRTEPGRCGLSV